MLTLDRVTIQSINKPGNFKPGWLIPPHTDSKGIYKVRLDEDPLTIYLATYINASLTIITKMENPHDNYPNE